MCFVGGNLGRLVIKTIEESDILQQAEMSVRILQKYSATGCKSARNVLI